jgi:hypothetical protein
VVRSNTVGFDEEKDKALCKISEGKDPKDDGSQDLSF